MDLAKIIEGSEGQTEEIYPVAIRCYALAGVVKGLGKISVDSQQLIRAEIGSSECCARVVIETPGEYPQTGTAIIAHDDIEKVCATLDRLKSANPRATKFNFMEAICEFGDLKIVVFNMLDGRMFFSAQAGNAQVHMELVKLNQLIDVLRLAKKEIEERRAEPSV